MVESEFSVDFWNREDARLGASSCFLRVEIAISAEGFDRISDLSSRHPSILNLKWHLQRCSNRLLKLLLPITGTAKPTP